MSDYRYFLSRSGRADAEPVVFIMLNPSTADEQADDPTIRRCRSFAWGAPFFVVNLFARRATNPLELWKVDDPVGPDNETWLKLAAEMGFKIIAAWGANAPKERVEEVLRLFKGCTLYCLGTTVHGAPRHPLYVEGTTPLEVWREL